MPVDTSIYSQLQPVKFESPLSMLAQVAQLKSAQNQNRLADLTFAQHQRSLDSDNALASLLADPKIKPEDVSQGLAAKGYGNAALAYTKQATDLQKSQADIGKTKADTNKSNTEALVKAAAAHRDELWNVNDPQAAADWIKAGYADPITGPILQRQMPIEAAVSRIPTDPAAFQQWRQQAALGATEFIKRTTVDANTAANNATSRANNAATNATSRANNAATVGAMLDANNINKEAARTQVVETPEGLALVDKGTGQVRPAMGAGGEQVQQKDSPKYQAQKLQSQLEAGIKMARDLIPKATASGAGALVDSTAGFFGKSTPGADAASQLDTLAGWMTTNVPRMQGPQSDKDTLLYRQMAAQVGDRTKPASQRLAALNTLEALQKKYASIAGNAAPTKAGTKPSLDDIFK